MGKVESWAACSADAARRDGLAARKREFLDQLPAAQKAVLGGLQDEPRDDERERPGSERQDEEERLFVESLPSDERQFFNGHKGLGNSQKAEVAWLEKMGYPYEEVDVRHFQ
jgi:hypothetical protein